MGKGNTSTSTTTAPNPVAGQAYNSIIGQAAGVAATPYTPYSGELVAPINAQQDTGISGINANANYAQPFINTALNYAQEGAAPITASDINQYMSPYTSDVVNSTQNQFNFQNQQQQQGVVGNAISQGALGGNRVGVAEANLANAQQTAQAPVIAGLENQGYTTGLNTALTEQQAEAQGAYSVGNLGVSGQNAALTGANAQFGAGTAEQTTQQSLDSAMYQQYINQMAYPFQTTQWLAGIDTGVGSQLGGTSTTTPPAPNYLNSIVGLGESGIGAAGTYMGDAAIAAALWGGGAVAGRAEGGVANRHHMTVPESPHTLVAQRRQLINGHRKAQLFPHGTRELPVPDDMHRVESHGGVFHFDPKKIDASTIHRLSKDGHENEILDLGPIPKHEVLDRIQKGERPIAVVERTPTGIEVRSAAGTHLTAHQQLAAMRKTKSPDNKVDLEHPRQTIMFRIEGHKRAAGGRIHGFATGGAPFEQSSTNGISGTPYGSASGFVPTMGITHGSGAPQPPKPPQQQSPQTPNLGSQANQIGNIAKALGAAQKPVADTSPAYSQGVAPVLPPDATPGAFASDNQIYWSGGVVRNYDAGGGDPSFDDRFSAVNPDVSLGNDPAIATALADGVVPPTSGDFPAVSSPVQTVATAPDTTVTVPTPANGVVPTVESPPTAPTSSSDQPRGIRNNNPGNIENGVFAQNQPGYVGSDGRFAQFDTPENGINATSSLLGSYGSRGINTISGIVNRWAPAADNNNTGAYISAVAKETGFDPNKPLDMSDPAVRTKIATAISHQENGTHGYDRSVGLDHLSPATYSMPLQTGPAPAPTTDMANGVVPSPSSTQATSPAAPNFFAEHRDLWPSLMAAGFRTMASRSPYLGVAVGEGGEQGMAQYSAEQEQHMKQSQLQLESRKLDQEMGLEKQKLAIETLPYSHMTMAQQQEADEKRRDLELKTVESHKPTPYWVGDKQMGLQLGNDGQYHLIDPTNMGGSNNNNPLKATPDPNAPSSRAPQQQQGPGGGAQPAIYTTVSDNDQNIPEGIRPPPASGRNEDYLAKQSSEDANLIKGMVDYQLNPQTTFSIRSRGGGPSEREAWINKARQYDPTYDPGLYTAHQKAMNDFLAGTSPNSSATVMTAGNTAILHASELYDLVDQVKSLPPDQQSWFTKTADTISSAANAAGVPFASYAAQYIKNSGLEGTPAGEALARWSKAKQLYSDEVTKFYSGGVGSEGERQRSLDSFNPALSSSELKGVIAQDIKMLNDKVAQYNNRLIAGMSPAAWRLALAQDPNLVTQYKNSRDVTTRIMNDDARRKLNAPGTGAQSQAPAMGPDDQKAMAWAQANPNDPRAAQIRQRLGQ